MNQGTILGTQKGRWITLAVLVAVMAALLMVSVVRAQEDSTTIEYAENGEGTVATFTATDPEGATSIAWFLGTASIDGVEAADVVDNDHFTIDDEDGMLKFSSPPDFENPASTNATANTYKVVVAACDVALDNNDACPDAGNAGYHKVTVMVTDVNEAGKVTLTTSTTNGTPQHLVGATLTATASDGDITHTTQDFTVDRAGEVTGVTWRWYRGGTEITGADAQDNTYTLLANDAGQHIRAVVYYIVTGNVDQEMAEETTDYPVLAARVGDNELEFDPATVSRTISEGDKDRNVGAPVTAMGNHGTVRYSLETGGDVAKFMIDEKTGQITTEVELNYEADAGQDDNCTATQNSCTVTVTATDSTGVGGVTAPVTIMITDVDEKPAFTTGSETVDVPEGSTVLWDTSNDDYSVTTGLGVTYTAMDPEGHTVNYSLMGPDASKFQLSDSPPVLSFASEPDFEAKASADGDNVYEVTVRASVGGDTGERMVRVTVGNVDEGPDVSGPSTRNFAENGEGTVATFTATDPEGATSIAWFLGTASIDGVEAADVVDNDHFTIDDEDGMLKFSSPPDFENPASTNATANTYKVVVAACDVALDNNDACPDAGNAGYHKVTVMVTDVNEAGKVTLTTSTTNGTPQHLVGATLTATASDGDITDTTQDFTVDRTGEVTGVTWRWYRGGTEITGADAQDNTYTLLANDANNRIRAVVRYQVDGNTGQESAEETTDYPVLAALVGPNQLKFDPAAVSRTISEGDKGRDVGALVTATGNHGTVRYTLNGTDSDQFEIDEKTGQITTSEDLNYEADTNNTTNQCDTANSCEVTITATDSIGESTSTDAATLNATVTITITDVNEKPAFTTGSETVDVPEGSTVLWDTSNDDYSVTTGLGVTYTAMDPEGRTVNYSLMGPDASKFQIKGTPPVLSFASKPDFEAKASADRDNVYEVTVRASVGSDTGERMVRVTVGNVDEGPVIEGPGPDRIRGNEPGIRRERHGRRWHLHSLRLSDGIRPLDASG